MHRCILSNNDHTHASINAHFFYLQLTSFQVRFLHILQLNISFFSNNNSNHIKCSSIYVQNMGNYLALSPENFSKKCCGYVDLQSRLKLQVHILANFYVLVLLTIHCLKYRSSEYQTFFIGYFYLNKLVYNMLIYLYVTINLYIPEFFRL